MGFSDRIEREKLAMKRLLHDRFYNHPRVLRMTRKAEWIMGDLFKVYRQDPSLLPARVRERFVSESETRVTADYIAGMTDRFLMSQ